MSSSTRREPATLNIRLLAALNLQTGRLIELLIAPLDEPQGEALLRLLNRLITNHGRPLQLVTDDEGCWRLLKPVCDAVNLSFELVARLEQLDNIYWQIAADLEAEYKGKMMLMLPDSPGWPEETEGYAF